MRGGGGFTSFFGIEDLILWEGPCLGGHNAVGVIMARLLNDEYRPNYVLINRMYMNINN